MSERARRTAVVLTAMTAWVLATGVAWWGGAGLLAAVRAPGPAGLGELAGLVAAGAAWAALTWLSGGLALAGLAAVPEGARRCPGRLGRLPDVVAPCALRRLVGAFVGVSLVAGQATGAAAAHLPAATAAAGPELDRVLGPAGPSAAAASGTHPVPDLDRPAAGWTPRAPEAPPRPQRARRALPLVTTVPRPAAAPPGEVVVRRGDTLWDIAARQLGPRAGLAEVAVEWPRWYAANRDVIGPDPDLLLPGQVLRPPTTAT